MSVVLKMGLEDYQRFQTLLTEILFLTRFPNDS